MFKDQQLRIRSHYRPDSRKKCQCRRGRVTLVYSSDTSHNKAGDARVTCNECGAQLYIPTPAAQKRNRDQAVRAGLSAVKLRYPHFAKTVVLKSASCTGGIWMLCVYLEKPLEISVTVPLLMQDNEIWVG